MSGVHTAQHSIDFKSFNVSSRNGFRSYACCILSAAVTCTDRCAGAFAHRLRTRRHAKSYAEEDTDDDDSICEGESSAASSMLVDPSADDDSVGWSDEDLTSEWDDDDEAGEQRATKGLSDVQMGQRICVLLCNMKFCTAHRLLPMLHDKKKHCPPEVP